MILTNGGFAILRNRYGKLTQDFVNGCNDIVAMCDKRGVTYPRAAYMLATAYHETAGTMQPIVERGSKEYFDKYDIGRLAAMLGNTPEKDGDGYLWRGRGYVQLTGEDNYQRAAKALNVNLIDQPDLALDPKIAADIMYFGMHEGWFTGKKLSDYINMFKKDYKNARRIINGTDKADKIAEYATVFEKALRSR